MFVDGMHVDVAGTLGVPTKRGGTHMRVWALWATKIKAPFVEYSAILVIIRSARLDARLGFADVSGSHYVRALYIRELCSITDGTTQTRCC